jgi:hypothetical protein
MKMQTLLLPAIAMLFLNVLHAQSCLPEGITYTTQEQVDNFPANYPGCKVIEGNFAGFMVIRVFFVWKNMISAGNRIVSAVITNNTPAAKAILVPKKLSERGNCLWMKMEMKNTIT